LNKSTSIALSDLMSALMMTFLFISVAFLAELENSSLNFNEKLNKALVEEFNADLDKWKAEITEDNVVRFFAPFSMGSTSVPRNFKSVLSEFCPRYVHLLTSDELIEYIKEVKVEGHTSKGWNKYTGRKQSFLNNMNLSKDRANNVLAYCYMLLDESIELNRSWFESNVHASGLASSYPILIDGIISNELSRRVDFMVVPKVTIK